MCKNYSDADMYAREQAIWSGQGWPMPQAYGQRQHPPGASTHMEVWDRGPCYSKQKTTVTYDGSTSWSDYRIQFELVADGNGWDATTGALELATNLRGLALGVLAALEPWQRRDYRSLVAALEMRFEPRSNPQVFRAQLKGRIRQRNESLVELAHDIKRLVRYAYPEAPHDVKERLGVEAFRDSLQDERLEWVIYQGRPMGLDEAVSLAMECEAFQMGYQQRVIHSQHVYTHSQREESGWCPTPNVLGAHTAEGERECHPSHSENAHSSVRKGQELSVVSVTESTQEVQRTNIKEGHVELSILTGMTPGVREGSLGPPSLMGMSLASEEGHVLSPASTGVGCLNIRQGPGLSSALDVFGDPPALEVVGNSAVLEVVGAHPALDVVWDSAVLDVVGDPPALDDVGDPARVDVRGDPAALDVRGDPPALDGLGDPPALDVVGDPIPVDIIWDPAMLDVMGDPPALNVVGEPPVLDGVGDPPVLDNLWDPPMLDVLGDPPVLDFAGDHAMLDVMVDRAIGDGSAMENALLSERTGPDPYRAHSYKEGLETTGQCSESRLTLRPPRARFREKRWTSKYHGRSLC